MTKSRKGQLSLEAGFILLIILFIIPVLWFSGPVQQSTEKIIDVNGVALGDNALESLRSAVTMAGMGGEAGRVEFTLHVPTDTVYIKYGNGSALGPHVNMTVLMYSNASMPSGGGFHPYFVDNNGDPAWMGAGSKATPFFYVNITKKLEFPLTNFPMCDPATRKNSTEVRGAGTRLKDTAGKPITLCCESGFNLRMYAERDIGGVSVHGRLYYRTPGTWEI